MRKRLMKMWREAKALHSDPVEAWASIIEDADKAKSFKQARGRGGFVRSSWQEVNELIAASNVYTIKITARTVSLASRQFRQCRWFLTHRVRAISLIGGTCLASTTGTATCLLRLRKPGVSKLTYRNLLTGTTPATSSPGVQTCRRRVPGCSLLY